MVDPVTAGALAELIASAVSAVAGRSWKKVRGTPEGRAVKAAIGVAVGEALRVSALPPGRAVDDAWVDEMEKALRPAFTTEVAQGLVACLADPSGGAAHQFTAAAQQALTASERDLAELGRALWVGEFLAVLPRRLFGTLSAASMRDPAVRELVDHVLRQRAEARASEMEPATPGELRTDLIALLRGLDQQARTGRLPPYMPAGADVTELSRMVRVRQGVRVGPAAEDPGEQTSGRVYGLPAERPEDGEPPQPWPQVAAEHQRLMVLADPGLGKSWLVRTETHRLCQEALGRLAGRAGAGDHPDPAAVRSAGRRGRAGPGRQSGWVPGGAGAAGRALPRQGGGDGGGW